MSLHQLKTQAKELSDAERKELIGYLVTLGRKRTAEDWERIEGKIADSRPSNWITEDKLDRVLNLESDRSE
ncbi:MAG TPA: hypothetical protein VIT91_06640 [Chthoniobacterales bacterium]